MPHRNLLEAGAKAGAECKLPALACLALAHREHRGEPGLQTKQTQESSDFQVVWTRSCSVLCLRCPGEHRSEKKLRCNRCVQSEEECAICVPFLTPRIEARAFHMLDKCSPHFHPCPRRATSPGLSQQDPSATLVSHSTPLSLTGAMYTKNDSAKPRSRL